jgi:hypothetical protein
VRHRFPATLPLVLVALLATACQGHSGSRSTAASKSSSAASSSSSGVSAASSASATSSAAASSSAATATQAASSTTPAAPGTRASTAAPAPVARTTVTEVYIEPEDSFDRVVFQLGGTGTPGFSARYVDHPTSPASGRPETVNGEGAIQVSITGTGLPADTGVREYSGPDHIATANTEAVAEVVYEGIFEGTTTAFIGTQARSSFRAYLLTNPTRVIVDVNDPG